MTLTCLSRANNESPCCREEENGHNFNRETHANVLDFGVLSRCYIKRRKSSQYKIEWGVWRQKKAGSGPTTGKGLVIWKLRHLGSWIHHSLYLERKTGY